MENEVVDVFPDMKPYMYNNDTSSSKCEISAPRIIYLLKSQSRGLDMKSCSFRDLCCC
jgi:hypothetical protein